MTANSDGTISLLTDKKIEQLFSEHYAVLTAYANKFLADFDNSKDIVQRVFVNLLENKNKIKIHTSIKSHLYTSVRNACINEINQKKNHNTHHDNLKYLNTQTEDAVDTILEQTELEYQIYKAIDELPEQCQRIFKMNRFDGYTNQEIADKLDISKRTVETQISKALKKLRTTIAISMLSAIIFDILFPKI